MSITTHLAPPKLPPRTKIDGYAVDEGGVRWSLVKRLRQEIRTGRYDEQVRLDRTIDRLARDLMLD